MKRFFRRSKPVDSGSPVGMRMELMGQQLPGDKLGEIALLAAQRAAADQAVEPEVAELTGQYWKAFGEALAEQEQRVATDVPISAASVMVSAGARLRQRYGDPVMVDLTHGAEHRQASVNAQAATVVAEFAMGAVFHDMINPPDRR